MRSWAVRLVARKIKEERGSKPDVSNATQRRDGASCRSHTLSPHLGLRECDPARPHLLHRLRLLDLELLLRGFQLGDVLRAWGGPLWGGTLLHHNMDGCQLLRLVSSLSSLCTPLPSPNLSCHTLLNASLVSLDTSSCPSVPNLSLLPHPLSPPPVPSFFPSAAASLRACSYPPPSPP